MRLASPASLAFLASLTAAALALAASSCGDDDMPLACVGDYLGDPAAPMEIELFALGEDLLPRELPACGPVDIVEPPQGGRVLFIGVRARNLDPCDVKMSGALRDPTDESISGLEARSTIFRPIAGRPGWGETSAGGDTENGFRYVANIPVCPNMTANNRDIQQQVGLVEIALTDKRGKRGNLRQPVFPRCAQPDRNKRVTCECLCQAGYTISKCLDVTMFPESPDAGACYPTDMGSGGGDGGGSDGSSDGG